MINFRALKKYNFHPPFFLYREEVIVKRFLDLKRSLPANFEIFYSVKANPNIHILRIFKKLGAGAEISSRREMEYVLRAGFPPEKIIFTGCGKSEDELRFAIRKKIFLIIAESISEIKKINNIALHFYTCQRILLRINPLFSSSSMFSMAGGSRKFGIDEEKISEVIKQIKNYKGVNLAGFHLFAGSNIFDEKTILSNTEYLIGIAHFFEMHFKINFSVLDIGGGFPIHHLNKYKFNVKKLTGELRKMTTKYDLNDKKIIIESGRFLIGPAGDYITEVVDKKISRGETFVIINGGINHFSKANFPQETLNIDIFSINERRRKSKRRKKVYLVGNLNTPNDFMVKILLPQVEIGDWIIIKNAGAYGLTAGIFLFSYHTIPKEYLLLENKRLKLINKKLEGLNF